MLTILFATQLVMRISSIVVPVHGASLITIHTLMRVRVSAKREGGERERATMKENQSMD